MKIFIKNIPRNILAEDLNRLISNYGKVVSVNLVTDLESGETRDCAFVEMASREEGLYVIKKLNGEPLEDKILAIEAFCKR